MMIRQRIKRGAKSRIALTADKVVSATVGPLEYAHKYNKEAQCFMFDYEDTEEIPAGELVIRFKAEPRAKIATKTIILEII